MFIVDLDIAWIDSPFLTHSKKIKHEKDLEKLLKSGAKVITIDPNKGVDLSGDRPAAKIKESEPSQNKTEEKSTEPAAPESTDLNREMSVALNIRNKMNKAINQLHEDLAANKAIDTQQLNPLIDQSMESLSRNNQALMSLAHISRRSQKLTDHTFSTFCIALNLAQCLNKNKGEQQQLGLAALLHDTGWMSIPIQLMGKRTAYSAMDLKLIHRHPELAAKFLGKSDIAPLVLELILQHHELEDGSGYPKKLKSEHIHPLTKVLAVADSYDERIHQLLDKPGMLPTNALRSLYHDAEKGLYHSEVVAALISLLGIYPVTTAVQLSNQQKAIVVEVIETSTSSR